MIFGKDIQKPLNETLVRNPLLILHFKDARVVRTIQTTSLSAHDSSNLVCNYHHPWPLFDLLETYDAKG